MLEKHQLVRVEFNRFKAFKSFSIDLRHFNILVGPNNAGKSTILAAFRILAAAMRKAGTRKAEWVRGSHGNLLGYSIDLSAISVAEENIFFNYDDSEPAKVVFHLSNKNRLTLFFPESGVCYLLPEARGKAVSTPTSFRAQFNCPIGFVPILGPVEHHESLYEKEAARLALFNYRAARNFRNIWFHYPDKFQEFRTALLQTWPGMDIERPEVDRSHDKPRLHMYCPEQRIPREIFWSGFGFQVWCQMLTHLIQSSDVSLFLIDEPDIYLHSELQRQLLGLLRNLGPDILIATHSTEIITEAETDDIVLVNKGRKSARRIKDPSQLEEVFRILGSNINPILTQLAKTRRALFVEGKDFQILGKFARKIGQTTVGNRADFAVVPVEGFNPERIRSLKLGMEATLGSQIVAAAVLDRDYRCEGECEVISKECRAFCDYVVIHMCKEIENFLLVPAAIDRAAERKVADQARRSGTELSYRACASETLNTFSDFRKSYVASQHLTNRRRYERINQPTLHETRVGEIALEDFDRLWAVEKTRLGLLPGKDALGAINKHLQGEYGVSITPSAIIDAMRSDEIPAEMIKLISMLTKFSVSSVGQKDQ
ncbi:AAA family ATPase [Nordella sp. HKS 07]|uniref:ATP-dependent nuclease n=1 Tax=Nordella sp. HKS 07 TaxID=2712222 RepID=UPI0013E1E808|nr:AAA family ATPase [Nordella sp. HKS 07]QIG49392.1 AAA family ATPase [Nordella sp. HKS 07]